MVDLYELSEGSTSCSSTHGHSSSTNGHSSLPDSHRYDVFISFRGVDTRQSFTNYLYEALIHANITTFLDDEEIETGEDLKPELESAIKASRASVIVWSKNYATSTWCLDELVLILEQRITSNHIVIHIFYHVEPTHVRKQQGSFGDAMAKHKQTMEAETNANKRSQWTQKMDRWNKALVEVANLKGNDVKGMDVTYVTSSGSIVAAVGYSSNNVNVVIWDTLAPPTTSRASIMCHEGGARSICVFADDIGSGSISPLIVSGGKGGDVGVHDFRYIATGRPKKHNNKNTDVG